MSKFSSLFSGSSANCTFISTASEQILVDVGAPFTKIKQSLESIGTSVDNISAVFITHTHSDHIAGLKAFTKQKQVQVYASLPAVEELLRLDAVSPNSEIIPFEDTTGLFSLTAKRFDTSHDSPGSSGYSFLLDNGTKATVCTDLGFISDTVKENITGSDIILIESNHDLAMLKSGPYPPVLKRRIASDKGHLSNNACAAVLPDLLKSGTTKIILGHLSRQNNTPEKAKSSAVNALMDIGAKENRDYTLYPAMPSGKKVEYI